MVSPVASPASPAGALAIEPLRAPTERAAWVRYLSGAPGATVFHTPEWSEVVFRTFRHRRLDLLAWRDGLLVGILPVMEVDSFLAGRLHVSVPYGTYGGILADSEPVRRALADAAVEQARRRDARVLELRSAAADVPGLLPLDGYVGFVRALPAAAGDVAAWLPKRARAAARHARDRDGLVVRHDPGQLEVVWELYARSMRRIASVNYPLGFFVELLAAFGHRCWVSVAWRGSVPVAGTVSLRFGDTITPYVLGVDERIRGEGATNLLYWSLMEEAVEAGLRRFDYGRSRADNHGAVGFKKNQGFTPQPLGYQRYVPPGQTAPNLKPSNPRFALARQVWRRLPLALTRPLGAWLSRALPG